VNIRRALGWGFRSKGKIGSNAETWLDQNLREISKHGAPLWDRAAGQGECKKENTHRKGRVYKAIRRRRGGTPGGTSSRKCLLAVESVYVKSNNRRVKKRGFGHGAGRGSRAGGISDKHCPRSQQKKGSIMQTQKASPPIDGLVVSPKRRTAEEK